MIITPSPRRARRLGRLAVKSARPCHLGYFAVKSALPRRLGRLALELTREASHV